jgi:CubicO group peptidase (beta-lactamase class C family)
VTSLHYREETFENYRYISVIQPINMNPFASRRKQIIALLIIIIAGLSGKLFSQENYSPEVMARISKVENNLGSWYRIEGEKPFNILERLKFHNIPAVSIAVVKDYKIDWVKAYGMADVSSNTPANTQTLFQAASISKSLNGVGAMKLVQAKKLDLNSDINNYLSSWKFPYDSASGNKRITLANLLSHSAGLTVHGFPGYEVTDSLPTVYQVIDGKSPANTKAVRSQFAPATRVQYSGGGTTISQVIISDVSKKPYNRYMYEEVLMPLGMTSSFYDQPAPAAKRAILATGYQANGNEIKGKYHVYPEQAAAGLWTNPTDLAKYIIEKQLSYQGKSSKVLSQEITRLRLTPVIDKEAALGAFIMTKGNATYFSHGGSNEGFRCQYFGDLENGNGVVVMVNSDNGAILNEIINSVASVYGWKEFYNPVVKKLATVSNDVLKSYTGKYELNPGFNLTISLDGNQLKAGATNQPTFDIYPEAENQFFVKLFDAKLEFLKTDDKVDKVILHQNRRQSTAKRIE